MDSLTMWHTFIDYMSSAQEDCGIELLQSVFLALTAIRYFLKGHRLSGDRVLHLTYSGLGLLMISCLLRESPMSRELGPLYVDAQISIRTLTVLAWVALAFRCFSARADIMRQIPVLVRLPAIRMVFLGTVLYCIPWPLDKGLVPLPKAVSQMIEELVELLATITFFIGTGRKPLPVPKVHSHELVESAA